MRKYFLLFSLLFTMLSTRAQVPSATVTAHEYDSLKQHGLINPSLHYNITLPSPVQVTPQGGNSRAGGCGCYIQPDASYTVAMAPNDDGSTGIINIPFNFCLYGQSWNQLYINNNGNISFGASYATFSASAFPTAGFTMVAPFWGDVDTRGAGVVYYKITPTALYVNWEAVGYFNQHTDLLNTFQLIITDGNDPVIGVGNNVAFCYQDMQWTTGDASSGVGGFGGVPATVGCNHGNGTDFIQFGRFDSPGTQYFGPFANNSQVSWLDNQSFTFNACSNTNIPPAIAGNIGLCDTLNICLHDTIVQTVQILSPELGQFTQVTASSLSPDFTVLGFNNGNTADITFQLIGNTVGTFDINITAWDNGTPPDTISFNLTIQVNNFPTAPPAITGADEYCQGGSTTLDAGTGYDTYQWNNGGGVNQTTTANAPGLWIVEVTKNGCRAWDTLNVIEHPNPVPQIVGYTLVCQGDSVPLSLGTTYTNYTWSTTETTPVIWVGAGNYTVDVTDSNGCTGTSLPFAVGVSNPTIGITGLNEFCLGDSTQLTASPTANFIAFNWSTGSNTSSTYAGASGWVQLTATDTAGCEARDSINLTVNPLPEPDFQTGPVCDGVAVSFADASQITSGNITGYDWNLGDGNTASGPNVNHQYGGAGTYNVSLVLTSDKGCIDSLQGSVTVYPNPTANYSAAPGCFQEVIFMDQSTPPAAIQTWYWGFGDDSTATQVDTSVALSHYYLNPGPYTTYLVVADTNGCTDSIAIDIIVDQGVQIPDTLPDILVQTSGVGNDKYDFEVFAPGFNECINYTFSVFNRWGFKVFEVNNDTNAPDLNCSACFTGKSNTGSLLSPGTYYFVLKGDQNVELHGTITIVD